MTLLVHIAHLRWDRDKWVHRLKLGIVLGFIVQVGCIVAFFTYIIIAAVEKQGKLLKNYKSRFVCNEWLCMTTWRQAVHSHYIPYITGKGLVWIIFF